MANATPVTATTEADETQEATPVVTPDAATEGASESTLPASITEVKGKAATAPKSAKAKAVSSEFANGIKRETY